MSKRKHRSPAEWEAIHQDWKSSGLSITEYCREIGISSQSLYNYRQRKEIAKPVKPASKSSFVELSALATPQTKSISPLEIVLSLGDGIELSIRRTS